MTDLAYNVIKHPRELKQHPLNIEIYGMEVADLDLVESIKQKGILEPIVIKEDNTILSGHRRWMASKDLKLDRIPCRVIRFLDKDDEEESLIEFNRQRQKNITQKMRESDHLGLLYKKRQGQRSDLEPRPDLDEVKKPNELRTDFKIAEKIGMKRVSFTKASDIWNKAKAGNETAKKLIVEMDSGKKAIDTAYKEIKKEEKLQERREELAQKTIEAQKLPDTIRLHHGDFLKEYEKLGKESIDCIITDPPYPSDWLENWSKLSKAAEYLLKPSGFLITYTGHIHLPKVIQSLGESLDYYWILSLIHTGHTQLVLPRNVRAGWKPILIYQKRPFKKSEIAFDDIVRGTGREKDAHEWQQGEEELRQLFESFTDPGDTILDPFMGSGTTISMAKKLNRIAIGFDIDEMNVAIVKGRVIDNAN